MTERLEQDNTTLGGGLLYIKTLKLYEQLGYSSMSEYLSCERVGGLGKTQCYKLMDVASVTAPANQLAAPMLQAPPIDTGSARLMLPQELVKKIGTERTYALKRRWRDSSPEEREELLDAAQNAPNRDFYETAYGETDRVSFEVQGDKIILWQHQIGTQVGTLTTLDPVLRSHVLDRLSLTPRARL